AQKHGARVALFGRKINNAEHQLAFIEMLRLITEGQLTPEEAVRAYHGVLQAKKINPKLPLEKDLQSTDQSMSYEGSRIGRTSVSIQNNPISRPQTETPRVLRPLATTGEADASGWPVGPDGTPAFSEMNPAQRRAYNAQRLTRRFG